MNTTTDQPNTSNPGVWVNSVPAWPANVQAVMFSRRSIREAGAKLLYSQEAGVTEDLDEVWDGIRDDCKEDYRKSFDSILALIRAEVEKVENPYLELGSWNAYKLGFEEARRKILEALK